MDAKPLWDEAHRKTTTNRSAAVAGTFAGEFPYVRVGNGAENLVILPGITPENEPPSRLAVWAYRLGFARFARDHALYIVNRRRNMPAGYTTRDMAADYAQVLEKELGPSCLMGFSTGGSIAQHVALDHPELVRRLVLVVSASRMSVEGQRICEHWQELARAGRWRELQVDMGAAVSSERNKRIFRAFVQLFGRFAFGRPRDLSDFLVTLDADLDHDATDRLPELSMPTLVIGGSEDPFFPEPLLRETAGKIPGAELRVYEGVGHGVPKERKRRYEDDALAFLNERSTSI